MKLKFFFTSLLLVISFFVLSSKVVLAAVSDRCTGCSQTCRVDPGDMGTCSGLGGLGGTYAGYCIIYQDGTTCGPYCNPTCTRNETCDFTVTTCGNKGHCTYTPPAGQCDSTCTAGGIPNNPCGFRNSDGSCTTNNSCCRRVCQNCACKTVSGGGTNDCAVEGASCCSGCQTINAYIVPSPVQPGRAVTFTFTSNVGYTNVAFDPNVALDPGGGATGCTMTAASCTGNPMGDGLSCWWRWACTAVNTSGNYTGAFSNSESCPKTIPYSIAVLTPTPTTTPRLTPTSTPTPTPIPCDAPCDGFSDRRCAIGLTCQPYGVAFLCKNPGCPIERQINCRCLNLTPTPTTVLARCVQLVPSKPLDTLKIGDEINFELGYTGLPEDIAFRIIKNGQIIETRFQSNPALPDFMRFRFTSPGRYSFAAYVKSGGVWR